MTGRRAILTDREREIIAGDADVADSYRYQTISRVRARFSRLEEDLEALERHGDLADELREVVCRESSATGAEPEADSKLATTVTGRDDADAPELVEVVERVADGWEDSEERLEARKRAAVAVLRYARKHGTVSKSEAKEEVYPEHPVEGQAERTWYRKNIRPVLNEAAEYDSSKRGYRLDVA